MTLMEFHVKGLYMYMCVHVHILPGTGQAHSELPQNGIYVVTPKHDLILMFNRVGGM